MLLGNYFYLTHSNNCHLFSQTVTKSIFEFITCDGQINKARIFSAIIKSNYVIIT